jgi:hypothetical protein
LPVPEDAIAYVHNGDTVQIRVDPCTGHSPGRLFVLTRNVSLDTRTMQTEIDVRIADLSIDPSMYANTYAPLVHKENVRTIPLLAIQRDGSGASTVLMLDEQERPAAGRSCGARGCGALHGW